MKYPSPADIAEMKARGYDRMIIERAEEQSKRWEEAQAVCSVIRSAFKGVMLGNGVGLTEAQGLDDHEDEATCAAYREKDEKEEWEQIASDDLNACNSSLSFFDPEGMRFHLPAYLIADINGEYGYGMESRLTDLNDHGKSCFALLSVEQRRAVREFLMFSLTDPDCFNWRARIETALDDCWMESPSPEQVVED